MIEDDPVVQKLLVEAETRGRANGEAWAQGRLQGLQEAAMNILQVRFPILPATSQPHPPIISIQDAEALKRLQRSLLLVPDEQAARASLELPAQGDLL